MGRAATREYLKRKNELFKRVRPSSVYRLLCDHEDRHESIYEIGEAEGDGEGGFDALHAGSRGGDERKDGGGVAKASARSGTVQIVTHGAEDAVPEVERKVRLPASTICFLCTPRGANPRRAALQRVRADSPPCACTFGRRCGHRDAGCAQAQPYLILDVRDPDDFAACHVMEGACSGGGGGCMGSCAAAAAHRGSLFCLSGVVCRVAPAVSYPGPRISQDRVTPQLFSYVRTTCCHRAVEVVV